MFICDLLKALNFLNDKYLNNLTVVSIDMFGTIELSNHKIYQIQYIIDCADGIEEWKES